MIAGKATATIALAGPPPITSCSIGFRGRVQAPTGAMMHQAPVAIGGSRLERGAHRRSGDVRYPAAASPGCAAGALAHGLPETGQGDPPMATTLGSHRNADNWLAIREPQFERP